MSIKIILIYSFCSPEQEIKLVERMQIHNDLKRDELFRVLDIFFRLIQRKTGRVLQNPRNYFDIDKYEKCDPMDGFDVQIILGFEENDQKKINMFTVVYRANDENNKEKFRLDTYRNDKASVIPDEKQKLILKKMYHEHVLRNFVFSALPTNETFCKDDGVDCDCQFILSLAKAILVIQGKDPRCFVFKLSQRDSHGTTYIRQKLRAMYDEDALLSFEGEEIN